MGTFDFLLQGLAVALDPMILLYALIGVTLGTAVGVLPGIGPALTVALLLPVTYGLDPAGSLIMFAGIYYGGMYGGSTTSILLNTPGESASIVTALEGQQDGAVGPGRTGAGDRRHRSFVAGLLATLALALIAPTVVKFALVFVDEHLHAGRSCFVQPWASTLWLMLSIWGLVLAGTMGQLVGGVVALV